MKPAAVASASMPCRQSANTGFDSVGTTTPTSRVRSPRSCRPSGLGRNCSVSIAVRIVCSVAGLTVCGALIARETVAIEKPARAATSLMVEVMK
ncbi:Uncharacterised protein [Burkholderia cenocepacia]|nr:Uncharacterised protein [Burkholderia cenocepacia]